MLPVRLRDTVLLRCTFEQRPDPGAAGEADASSEPGGVASDVYPDDQLLQLSVETVGDAESLAALIEGKLDDERLPFTLAFEMGFLFSIPEDDDAPAIAEIEPTLVWLAFPYMRELIADLTGRAPIPQYFLPPLTRLPQPPG
jgi:hypothetical protein